MNKSRKIHANFGWKFRFHDHIICDAESFERIHRSNLVGMGILPCEFIENQTPETLGINGKE